MGMAMWREGLSLRVRVRELWESPSSCRGPEEEASRPLVEWSNESTAAREKGAGVNEGEERVKETTHIATPDHPRGSYRRGRSSRGSSSSTWPRGQ